MNNNDWAKFIELTGLISANYGKPFESAKQNLWWQLLADVEISALEKALFRHMKESSFEPKPADLIKLTQPDFDEMFNRMIKKGGFNNDAEYYAWQQVGYACRTQLKEDVARLRFKAEYLRQVELLKQPRTPQSHQLEYEKPVNIKDQMVDSELHKYQNKSPEEIKEMLANFKLNKVKK